MDAFERAMASESDTQRRAQQKQRLAEAIRVTEASYRAPAAAPEIVADAPAAAAPEVSLGGARRAPAPDMRAEPHLRAEPRLNATEPADEFPAIGDDDRAAVRPRSRARRAPFATMLSVVVILALAGAGAWWVVSTGAFQSAAERDTSVPNPPLELENESFAGSGDATSPSASSGPARIAASDAREEGWITLFTPSDPTTITLDNDASAAIDGDPFGQFARIVTRDSDSAVGIDIPPGTLETLTGKTAQFSIIARADDDAETQMSVTCDLAEFGDCGRLRFDVIASDNEFLFRVDLPDGVRVSGPGRLIIVPDIENDGRAVKLSGVRVRELRP